MVTYKGTQPRVVNATMDGEIPDAPKQPAMADYTVYFQDWREADGVRFPFKMRRTIGADTMEEWSVSKVKVNPKIDPKKFAVESGS